MTTSEDVLNGSAWTALAGRIAAMIELVVGAGVPADDLHRAEGTRYLLRYLAAGIAVCVEHDDVDHPEIGTLIENRRSWGLDNPDTKYGFCRLAPDAAYVVSGEPGSACHMELQVNTGHFGDGDFAGWNALSRFSTDEFVLEPDGSLEIVISSERPPGATNWMATGPRASYLHVREYFADWANERPAVLSVARVGAEYPAPPLSTHDMAGRLDLLDAWLDIGARCWNDLGRGLATGAPGPVQPFLAPLSATGLGGQAYGMGAYRCGPDDAVILEFRPPQCRYWSLSLATWFWESADIANRQCSINHRQAVVDDDGLVRAVISQSDPGVANWLDPAGYERGTLAVRYLFAPAGCDDANLPEVGYSQVHFADLAASLPSSTATVDPVARANAIGERRHALVWRYRR